MREDMQIVELTKVVKTYKNHIDSRLALKDLSLSVERGEFLIISGPSGAGKTTLLSIIARLISQDSGVVKNSEEKKETNRSCDLNIKLDLKPSNLKLWHNCL